MEILMWRMVLILLFSGIVTSSSAYAQDTLKLDQQKIEAGLLYNVLKYTVWPESKLSEKADELVVCTFGGDLFGGNLVPMEGRSAQKKTIHLIKVSSEKSFENCHVVVLGLNDQHQMSYLAKKLETLSVLSISKGRNFATTGGMIEFSLKDSRVHLRVNKTALKSSGIHVDDRILKLAETIE